MTRLSGHRSFGHVQASAAPQLGHVEKTEDPAYDVSDVAQKSIWWMSWFLDHLARFLSAHDIKNSLRLINSATAALFQGPKQLLQPLNPDVFGELWAVPDVLRSLNISQRRKLVCFTAASGSIANLELAYKAAGCALTEDMMELPAAAGQLESCQWLHKRGCPWGKALLSAARGGHQLLCEWMLHNDCPWQPDAVYAAACGGHWGLAERLLQRRASHPVRGRDVRIEELLAAAAEGCDLGTFKQLHNQFLDGVAHPYRQRGQLPLSQQERVILAAARSPTPDWEAKLDWLEEQGYRYSASAAAEAAKRTDPWSRIESLRRRGHPLEFDQGFFRDAGHAGNFDIVRLVMTEFMLYQHGVVAAEAAAEVGRLGFLRALHGACHLDGDAARIITVSAARGGHLPVVAWAVEELGYDISSDPEVFPAAAESGNLQLMRWVRERNTISSRRDMESAIAGGCEAALEWMETRGYLSDPALYRGDLGELYFFATVNGDLATLGWLQQRLRGTRPPEDVISRCADALSPRTALRWLEDQAGCRVDWERLEMRFWLKLNRMSISSRSTVTLPSSRIADIEAYSRSSRLAEVEAYSRAPTNNAAFSSHSMFPCRNAVLVWTDGELRAVRARIASFLSPNDVACSMRPVCKATAAEFRGPEHTTIHLSLPCPHDTFRRRWAAPEAMRPLSLKDRLQFVCLVAASGVVDNLEVAFDAAGCTPREEMLEAAAAAGHGKACQWLHERGCAWGKALAAAALGGHQELFEQLLDLGCPRCDEAPYAAARGGHLQLMDWLGLDSPTRESTVRVDKLLAAAAEGCDLGTLQQLCRNWLGRFMGRLPRGHRRLHASHLERILTAAAGSPTPDWRAKVEWLEGLGYPKSPRAVAEAAAQLDGKDRLEWLRLRGYPLEAKVFDREFFCRVGRGGDIAVVRAVMTDAVLYHLSKDAAEGAAEMGRLEFLKELHQCCRLDTPALQSVVLSAARGGHLLVVAWAVEELGYDIRGDEEILPASAESGNVQLLNWVWVRNPSSSPQNMEGAAKGGCELALDWMVERELHMHGDPAVAYAQAARNGDMPSLLWLARHLPGPLPPDLVARCIRANCPPAAIRWLEEEAGGCVDSWTEVGVAPDSPGVYGFLARTFRSLSMLSDNSNASASTYGTSMYGASVYGGGTYSASNSKIWVQQVLAQLQVERQQELQQQ